MSEKTKQKDEVLEFEEMVDVPLNSPKRYMVKDDAALKKMFPKGMTKKDILLYAPDDLEMAIISVRDRQRQAKKK